MSVQERESYQATIDSLLALVEAQSELIKRLGGAFIIGAGDAEGDAVSGDS
jgi:hypothetical protein